MTFTAPAVTSGNSTAVYAATLTGSVVPNGDFGPPVGAVRIDFDNTPHVYTYSGGSFTLTVNDVNLTVGQTVALTATVVDTPISVVSTPTISTNASAPIVLGGTLSDTATLTGRVTQTPPTPDQRHSPSRLDRRGTSGSVTFKL